jgi:endonuclease/exonuclease/phosphatase (EEP) superfamily protein YafD
VRSEAHEDDRGALSGAAARAQPAGALRRAAWFAGFALDAVAATMLGAAALQFVIGTYVWPFTFVLHFFELSAPWWIAGLAVALARRSKWRSALHGAGLVAWCVVCGPRLVRAFEVEPARAPGQLQVVTFNTGNGCASPEQLCATLRGSEADVVFLQELAVEHARAIETARDIPFPHRALFPAGIPGKGVLARHPLRDVRLVQCDDGATQVRGQLAAPGGDVEFVDLHAHMHVAFLGHLTEFDQQVEALARELPRDRPCLIAGDFNLTTADAILDPLRDAGFQEAFAEMGAGLGLSFPLYRRYRDVPLPPVVRIDHVWFRGLECADARLGDDAGSDHLPLRARFVHR